MYYGHMSKQDILNSSRPFLYAIYKKYVNRACENLGVPVEKSESDTLTEQDYPSEFKKFSQKEREKEIEDSGISDADFLASFPEFKKGGKVNG